MKILSHISCDMGIIIALAVYLLPNTYVLLRIKSLFRSKRNKVIFAILYTLLVAVFPITEMLSHSNSHGPLRPILIIGYISLPFLLYLFLLLLIFDIIRGINLLLKIIPSEILRSKGFRAFNLCLLFAIPAAVVAIGMARYSDIKIHEYQIKIQRKSSHLAHLKIALASDFHLREITDEHFMERFASKVNSLDADILLIPGDLLEGDRQDGQLDEFERQFRQIKTTYGIFASLGNHEFYGRLRKMDFFRSSGITVLRDTAVVIHNSFVLAGRDYNPFGQRKPVTQLIQAATDSLPVIVMDHSPTDIDGVSAANADIMVSGHTHEGQLFPFNYIAQRVYKLSWGYRKFMNTHVFVTSGVQLWGPPVRTAGDSEIMLITASFVDR